jgi:hypothetical protein
LEVVTLKADLFQDSLFRRFQEGIDAPEHYERQNNISVFTSDIDIPEAVIGDTPDKTDKFIVRLVVHCWK